MGTALGSESRVWFTLVDGIFNEIYFPDVDQASAREMGLVVTGGKDFFSEERKDTLSRMEYLEAAIPAFRVVTTCIRNRYRIEKEILTDPRRNVVLQQTVFTPLDGTLDDYRLFVVLAPHLKSLESSSKAWWGDYKGVPMLFAEYDDTALALACSTGWGQRSVGQAGSGSANGWRELHDEKKISQIYAVSERGSVNLLGEIDLVGSRGKFTLALGFGPDRAEAGLCARASLLDGFDRARDGYLQAWKDAKQSLLPLPQTGSEAIDLVAAGAAVMRVHESKNFPGGFVSSLFAPPHRFVRLRDLVETAGAFLAAGLNDEFLRILLYLESTQEADGSWPREQWLDGTPCRNGTRIDETALPVLLAGLGLREGALGSLDLKRLWKMVRMAAQFLVMHGPVSVEEHWEDEGGYNAFTLTAEISALLEAAAWSERCGEPDPARYLLETADAWNAGIDGWINPVRSEVSPDVLFLVRFGLRPPDDPRIRDTLRLIDSRPETVDPDRLLFTAERAQYELAAGNREEAERLLASLESRADNLGLFPLVRAHAEHIKLRRSLRDGSVFDRPGHTVQRYMIDHVGSACTFWRFNHKIRSMVPGKTLRIEAQAPAVIHWTTDGWASMEDAYTRDTGLGMHFADLPTHDLETGRAVEFTFYWRQAGKWENRNFTVEVK